MHNDTDANSAHYQAKYSFLIAVVSKSEMTINGLSTDPGF